MQDKATLRGEMRRWRRELSPADRYLWDCAATLRLMRHPCYSAADTLLCFVSSPEELSTLGIIAHAILSGRRVAVPRWSRGDMEFCYFTDYRDLAPDRMGLLQPPPHAEVCSDFTHALCVTPALAVTRTGYRLGYGGGYYDRFLSTFTGCTATLIYPPALLHELPHERYDIAVDWVITPDEAIKTNARKELLL